MTADAARPSARRPAREPAPSAARRAALGAGRLRAAGSRFFAQASYTRKWLVLGTIIGVIAGLGAVVFYTALTEATHLLLAVIGGYVVPTPAGEGHVAGSAGFTRPWAIPLVVAGGGLLSGALVFGIAPDAEGHGTDAAISAVHENPRGIRLRTVVVKIVASAITIGSGGSGGREGPTGQISAGFGSLLARLFDLSPADARICVASGIGSGIGSIFSAPLGGAVLAAEILYRDDFEVEALLPSFIASVVGFALFGAVEGYGPLFGFVPNFRLESVSQLGWFAVIGILGGAVGLLYAKGFYGIGSLFARLPAPRWTRPAIGGLFVGLMALAVPQVLGTGYGWVQRSLGLSLFHIPLWIVLLVPLARIVATGLSIGSGGSGGIFGPGMVIGAFVGGSVVDVAHRIVPSSVHDPAAYVVVGMMACFGSIARAPLAVMLMVAEMTGTLTILVPAMLAVGLATFIVRRNDDTIYRSQLRTRADSPAHRILAGMPLLASIPVERAMARPRLVLAGDETVAEAVRSMRAAGVTGAPFSDSEGRFAGIVTLAGLDRHAESDASTEVARLADPADLPVQHSRQLDVALEALTASRRSWVPVVDAERRVVGTLGISDVVRAYRRELQATLSRIGAASELPAPARPGRESHGGRAAGTGSYEVVVEEGSSLDGRRIRDAGLPPGAIITTVERAGTVVLPDGRTELKAGDRLALFATAEAATTLGELARRPESGGRPGAPAPGEDGDLGARAPERAAAHGRTSPPGGTGEPPAASGS